MNVAANRYRWVVFRGDPEQPRRNGQRRKLQVKKPLNTTPLADFGLSRLTPISRKTGMAIRHWLADTLALPETHAIRKKKLDAVFRQHRHKHG